MEIRQDFGSLSEFLDFAGQRTDMPNSERSSRNTGMGSWYGSDSYADAERIAFRWDEGAAKVENLTARIAIKGISPRQEVRMREVGPGVISMGAYLSGHPQPYVTLQDSPDHREGAGKIVRVMLNVCASGGVSAKILNTRGAAVLAMCGALEKAGRRTEIVVCMANGGGGHRKHMMDMRVTVKRPEQTFNLNTLAFAVAHPGMFRRFFFSAMEVHPAETRRTFNVPGGYGTVVEIRKEAREGYLYLGGASLDDPQWRSEAAATKWVREQVAAQGVTLND